MTKTQTHELPLSPSALCRYIEERDGLRFDDVHDFAFDADDLYDVPHHDDEVWDDLSPTLEDGLDFIESLDYRTAMRLVA